jgi:hypothetical protein
MTNLIDEELAVKIAQKAATWAAERADWTDERIQRGVEEFFYIFKGLSEDEIEGKSNDRCDHDWVEGPKWEFNCTKCKHHYITMHG